MREELLQVLRCRTRGEPEEAVLQEPGQLLRSLELCICGWFQTSFHLISSLELSQESWCLLARCGDATVMSLPVSAVIPKRNSVFSVEVNGFVSHIYGSRFEQRASERSAKKFKVHGSIDL